jgi:hypothetical protein
MVEGWKKRENGGRKEKKVKGKGQIDRIVVVKQKER